MEKLKKVIYSILVLLLIFTFLVYYESKSSKVMKTSSTEASNGIIKPTTTEEKFTIGWSVYNSAYEFFMSMQEGVLAKAAELGIDVITHDQKGDVFEMIAGCIRLIKSGIDALVISPINPEAMFIIVELAKDAGIPVIVVDIGDGDADVDALIISDSLGGGIWAGEYALSLIDEHSLTSNNVAIIRVEETSKYAQRRGSAFKSVMMESGYEVIAEITANSDQTQAYEAMKNILATYSDDLAVVFCENDRMALGAAQAIDEAGKKGQIMVIGFDGDPSAITAIQEGLMQGTIAQQPFEMGALGVETANTLLTGGNVIYDDRVNKELLVEVFLIDESGRTINRQISQENETRSHFPG